MAPVPPVSGSPRDAGQGDGQGGRQGDGRDGDQSDGDNQIKQGRLADVLSQSTHPAIRMVIKVMILIRSNKDK